MRSAFSSGTTLGVEDPHLHFIVNDGYMAEGPAYRAEITGTAKGYNSEHKSASRVDGDCKDRDLQLVGGAAPPRPSEFLFACSPALRAGSSVRFVFH